MKPNFDLNPKPAPAPAFYGGKGASLVDSLKAQQIASASIGTIQSPPVPTADQIGPQSLFYQTITVPQQKKYPVQIKGDFIYVEGIGFTGANGMWQYPEVNGLSFKTDTLLTPIQLWEAYREYRFPAPFNYVEFVNNTNAPVNITFWSGFGGIRRDRNLSPHFSWTGAANVGGVNVPLNHNLVDGPFKFIVPVSRYVQNGVLTYVKVWANAKNPPNAVLWLYSAYTNAPVFAAGSAFIFDPGTVPADTQLLACIPLTTSYTGHTGSTSTAYFATGLNIPIFSTETDSTNPVTEYVMAGYLVASANYNPPGAEGWYTTLGVQFA